jgi:hypothetical protein
VAQFQDVVSGDMPHVHLWTVDEITELTLALIREAGQLNESGQVPRMGAHDAYYVALARWLRDEEGYRTVFVTNDRQPWLVAQALGLEAFHGNTCDLGIGKLNVGIVGVNFPENRGCQPCSLATCPSRFEIDLVKLPQNLGSGTPRTKGEIEATARPR